MMKLPILINVKVLKQAEVVHDIKSQLNFYIPTVHTIQKDNAL